MPFLASDGLYYFVYQTKEFGPFDTYEEAQDALNDILDYVYE